MRVVVDTNVFISALMSPNGHSRVVLRQCLNNELSPLMSMALYHEYEAVQSRKELFDGCSVSKSERENLFNALCSVCIWTPIYYLWRPNLADETDNHVIELAVAGCANLIITHNIKDFKRNELTFPDLFVLTPEEVMRR